jgi:hypothetical protein
MLFNIIWWLNKHKRIKHKKLFYILFSLCSAALLMVGLFPIGEYHKRRYDGRDVCRSLPTSGAPRRLRAAAAAVKRQAVTPGSTADRWGTISHVAQVDVRQGV